MRAPTLLGLAAFTLAGCAKFPSGGANNNYTVIHFTATYAVPIQPNLFYYVAIRRIVGNDTTSGSTYGPVPVYVQTSPTGGGSTNGIVAGLPTHLVQYVPGSARSYLVYRFPGTTPTENTNDTDPGPLGSVSDVLTGVDPTTTSTDLERRTIDFTITTQDLALNNDGTRIDPTTITGIQFNILSSDQAPLTNPSNRHIDALGDNRSQNTSTANFNRFLDLRTSRTLRNSDSANLSQESSNDTYPSQLDAVDLVDYTVEVRIS